MVGEGVVKTWYGGDVETLQVGDGVAPESANLLRLYSAVIDVIIANEIMRRRYRNLADGRRIFGERQATLTSKPWTAKIL